MIVGDSDVLPQKGGDPDSLTLRHVLLLNVINHAAREFLRTYGGSGESFLKNFLDASEGVSGVDTEIDKLVTLAGIAASGFVIDKRAADAPLRRKLLRAAEELKRLGEQAAVLREKKEMLTQALKPLMALGELSEKALEHLLLNYGLTLGN